MPEKRFTLVLAGIVAALATVAVALAATLLDNDDGGDSAEQASANAGAVATPTQDPSPTVAIEQPEGLPDETWIKLDALPDKLRNDLLERYEAGSMQAGDIAVVIDDYENRNQGVRVGTVLEATDSMLRLEVYSTGERAEVLLDGETVLRRGHDDIAPGDLQPDELVLVVSRDGGQTAFSVTAFGVGAP
jgi:hypothetical protein